jgi:hypothetical protein
MPHDDSRLYYQPSTGRDDPKKLEFFKGADESREKKDDMPEKKFVRDEL